MLWWPRALSFTLAGLMLQTPDAARLADELWQAARTGDVQGIVRTLERGADVNARTRYGVGALSFAADKGHIAAVRTLVTRGADVNARDSFYGFRAIDLALFNGHLEVARFLLESGSEGAKGALQTGIRANDVALVTTALRSKELDPPTLASALEAATRRGDAKVVALVKAAADAHPVIPAPPPPLDAVRLKSYAGTYGNKDKGLSIVVTVKDTGLAAVGFGPGSVTLRPDNQTTFTAVERKGLSVSFMSRGDAVDRMLVRTEGSEVTLHRVRDTTTETPAERPPGTARTSEPAAAAVSPSAMPLNWPSFRGRNTSGIGDGQGVVADWDVVTGRNVKWKTPIPGLANSSPIVWGDRVFVTTAISSHGDATIRTGHTSDFASVPDVSEHSWRIYALETQTGRIAWEREAFRGVPKIRRNAKSTHANSTPATDGQHVVALFGSIGLLACYDRNGKSLWTRNIGSIDSGWFLDPTYQWGHASSPIIYQRTVIVQADSQKDSFVAAYELATGEEVWRTERDEISTWGSPTLARSDTGDELVTNGTKIRGYDPRNGELLWSLGPNSEITVASPVAGPHLVYVTGGYQPVRPIYAIRPGARGDISLDKGQHQSDTIAWSNDQGTYIPTPILYGEYFYTLGSNGVLTAYEADTGTRVYRARIAQGGAFSASPVAANGRLYVANEDGDVHVIRGGPRYELLAKHSMGEVVTATPAISGGLLIIRTLRHVYALGR